ncbi:hypothetical protein GMRT_16383 [Giardia muris]|uniref:Uncharacterized protein n=1 Tax=Giardia muris TaxID=5742 RepID=A0A4Z1SLN3_GIAMU|nr:hypothetical protein GMRT_16383 [Giardia muris]|eukprot:TNJ26564.1 hypothetical protein GMRT_16383 [Giardia muris]
MQSDRGLFTQQVNEAVIHAVIDAVRGELGADCQALLEPYLEGLRTVWMHQLALRGQVRTHADALAERINDITKALDAAQSSCQAFDPANPALDSAIPRLSIRPQTASPEPKREPARKSRGRALDGGSGEGVGDGDGEDVFLVERALGASRNMLAGRLHVRTTERFESLRALKDPERKADAPYLLRCGFCSVDGRTTYFTHCFLSHISVHPEEDAPPSPDRKK